MTRNRYVDLLRVAALTAVVLGHWLVIDVAYRQGELAGRNGALAAALARLAVDGFLPDGRLPWPVLGTYAGGLASVLLAGSRPAGQAGTRPA